MLQNIQVIKSFNIELYIGHTFHLSVNNDIFKNRSTFICGPYTTVNIHEMNLNINKNVIKLNN